MARLARLVIPGLPYHVTQRGYRRGTTFFEDGDFAVYRDLLAEGRTLGEAASIKQLEQATGRALAPRKRGPKRDRSEFRAFR